MISNNKSIKKYLSILIFSIVLVACSCSDNSTVPPKEKPPVVEKPVALNDVVTGIEDEELIISNLLDNDTTLGSSRISSIDETSTNGITITDNRNGIYSYNPAKSFVGIDTFTYTLCDRENTPNCSTATVTITIEDQGTPKALDDIFYTVENTAITITSALENDILTDDASLFSVDDNNATTGSVELNGNNEIIYTPLNNFIGDDSFTYTICDDDTPNPSCVTATITISILEKLDFNIPVDLANYYDNVVFSKNADILTTKVSEQI